MEKCSMCSKQFPEATIIKMVQIMGRKAYLQNICPACRSLAENNPNYYEFNSNVSTNASKAAHGEEWDKVIKESARYRITPDVAAELIGLLGKSIEKVQGGTPSGKS